MEGLMECVDKLTALMRKEVDILTRFAAAGERIMQNLEEKDWESLQVHLTLSNKLSQSIEKTEAERDRQYRDLKELLNADENANFYQVVSGIETEERRSLTEEFRNLKLALLQAQGISWRIEAYVASAGNTMKELMNRIFPHRKGTLYSRNGMAREAGNNPMVLNKKL